MYFVDGAFRLRIEDEVMEMAPGSFAFVPRDTPHSWQNVSEGQAHMLFVFTPVAGDGAILRAPRESGQRGIGCAGGLHGARGGRGHDRPRPSAGAVPPDLTWCRSLGTSRILVPKSAYIRTHPHTSDPAIDAYPCLRAPRFAIRRSAVRARLAPSRKALLSRGFLCEEPLAPCETVRGWCPNLPVPDSALSSAKALLAPKRRRLSVFPPPDHSVRTGFRPSPRRTVIVVATAQRTIAPIPRPAIRLLGASRGNPVTRTRHSGSRQTRAPPRRRDRRRRS